MITIEKDGDYKNLKDGNVILGTKPVLNSSRIRFVGQNNILYCEEGVKLSHSNIDFNGSNSLIYLGTSPYKYFLNVYINNDQVFHMGKNNYINEKGKLTVILSEQKHLYIGSYCLFSTEVVFRNADPHLIYDGKTKKRINQTKSIFIGDHVWVGYHALILKGSQIDSGSIIGAMSVVANKKVPHNTSWAGNPAKQIKSNIFWDSAFSNWDSNPVHTWIKEDTDLSQNWEAFKTNRGIEKDWIYNYNVKNSIGFDTMDAQISACETSQDKLNYFLEFNETYNQFAHLD